MVARVVTRAWSRHEPRRAPCQHVPRYAIIRHATPRTPRCARPCPLHGRADARARARARSQAFEIFQEALHSSQEAQIGALQQQLATTESETARLGRQLGAVITAQRDGTDDAGRRARVAEGELATARSRLVELEAFHRGAATRMRSLEERSATLEEETLHWRQRCAPLRESCRELDDEVVALRAERQRLRTSEEAARQAQQEAEAAAVAARALADGAQEAASQARAQAQAVTLDSEGRWLRQGLSVMLSRIFAVVPLGEADEQVPRRWLVDPKWGSNCSPMPQCPMPHQSHPPPPPVGPNCSPMSPDGPQ